MLTEVFRGTSWHRFLGRRNGFSARLEVDSGQGADGHCRRLRFKAGSDPAGPDIYRCDRGLGGLKPAFASPRRPVPAPELSLFLTGLPELIGGPRLVSVNRRQERGSL
jgi:hypothetical protein